MRLKSSVLFKVLLNRFHPGTSETFLQGVPAEEAKEIARQDVSSSDPSLAFTWKQNLIEQTHYSWLVPPLQQIPSPLQDSVIAALSEQQATRLRPLFKAQQTSTPLALSVRNFLIDQLYQKWNPQDVLPKDFLPQTSLTPLLGITKGEIVELIDFLALHDLGEALRHIVNTRNLKMVYSCLSPKKQQYLRICLHQKERVAATKLEIEKWNGDPKQFETMLHKRGMFRLGKAISGQHPQFLWHLTHILDTGRGAALSKYYQEDAIPNVTPHLIQQLLFVMNFLKKKGAQ